MPRRIITLEVDDLIGALRRVPLLEACGEQDLRDIAARAHVLTFTDGEIIVPEGEEGLGFYLILAGRVRVEHDDVVVNRLGKDDFFGEIALLEDRPRVANVVADGEATCLGILRSFFRPLLVRNPRLALTILDEEARRLGTVG